jgi:hypothetical protein
MHLTIVYDTYSECHTIYIGGICRGEWDEGNFEITDLIECYETFARDQPVVIERIEVDSYDLGIYDDFEGVKWPEQLGELMVKP